MSISPPSDIVLDVVRAADPKARQLAVDRLTSGLTSASKDVSSLETSWSAATQRAGQFSGALDSLKSTPDWHAQLNMPPRQSHTTMTAYGKFEAFVLQSFVQAMLPEDSETVFGSGTAGDIWKSMLAEQLAGEIARNGGVGIAKQIEAGQVSKAAGGQLPVSDAAAAGAVPLSSHNTKG